MRSTKADKARKQERRDLQGAQDTTSTSTTAESGARRSKRSKQSRRSKEPKQVAGPRKATHLSAPVGVEPPYRRPLFLPRGSLRRRGWTDSGIARFLGEPDAHAPNPVVPSAARMRLYDEERVAAVEATETWREWRTASEHRREAARIRAEERARERAEHIARTGVYAELASHVANR